MCKNSKYFIMEFQENELIRFQHAAAVSGWTEKEGNVSITNLRIFFVPDGSGESLSFTWANVKNVVYSPAKDPKERAAMQIETVMGGKKHQIYLIDSSKQARFAELEKVRGIISDIRKPGSSSTASAPASSSASHTGNSHYKHISHPPPKEYDLSYDAQGRSNSVLANLTSKQQDGKTIFHLTPDAKILIFKRFPAVQKAFASEVPLKMSEKAFWESFFKSQYFTRPADQGNISTDRKFFTRYESADPKAVRKRPREVEAEVDLLASAEDLAPFADPADLPTSQIAHWINEDSSSIIAPEKRAVAEQMRALHLLRGAKACEELKINPQPDAQYTVIKMHKEHKVAHEEHVVSSQSALLGMSGYYDPAQATAHLPTGLRAKKVFDSEIQRCSRLNALKSAGHDHLDGHTKQEMRETFIQVTDLLRHFYACLRNADTAASASDKAEGIISRLADIAQTIEAKKTALSKGMAVGHKTAEDLKRDAALPIWSGMLGLIHRAKVNWEAIAGSA